MTSVAFTLPKRGPHRLAVYDLQGREVALLASGIAEAGSHNLTWDGRNAMGTPLPSGLYFVRLEYGGRVERRKLILTR